MTGVVCMQLTLVMHRPLWFLFKNLMSTDFFFFLGGGGGGGCSDMQTVMCSYSTSNHL